jgi:hypothetical protein
MKLFKISKYSDCDEISDLTIFGLHIDFREWYVIKDDGLFSTNGWSESWFTGHEIRDSLEEDPKLVYKRVPYLQTMFHSNYRLRERLSEFCKYILCVIFGFVIGKLI